MDGTGPLGTGRFGRGLGPCGRGMAFGRGAGRGLGMGWRRGAAVAADLPADPYTEVEALKERIDALTAEIEELRSRAADPAK